ncbi:uncharacterized protein [Dermacentor andersoni]|uniref:uncharacterized protein n=1 Tax=Dermacentor andersoni TaxID=34620 RepID=UPI002155D751|nr:uncharacterized protein LOC126533473 [Dermacentor andersoni]
MSPGTCFVVLLLLVMGSSGQDHFPGSSPLSWLRNRVFGSKQNEQRFINRVAAATQSLAALMNDPVVVAELNRYYGLLLRNPDVNNIVESVRPSTTRPATRRISAAPPEMPPPPTTTTSSRTSTLTSWTTGQPESPTTTATPTTTVRPASPSAGTKAAVQPKQPDSLVSRVNGVEYRFYFDPKLVVRPPDGPSVRARVRRHLNLVRLNDVENCMSFLICEMSRYPLRYGPLGVKVDRFFRYPMWDTGSSAAHYAAMARHGRRDGGCRGRISSCRHPIGPLFQRRYSFRYGHF